MVNVLIVVVIVDIVVGVKLIVIVIARSGDVSSVQCYIEKMLKR